MRESITERAAQRGLSYRLYGEFFEFSSKPPAVKPAAFANIPPGHLSPTYAGYDLSVTDQARVDAWRLEFEDFVRRGTVPDGTRNSGFSFRINGLYGTYKGHIWDTCAHDRIEVSGW